MEKVSVIMPMYNGAQNIKRAINSVLNQDYPNIEVIVVDDASKDNSVEIVESIKDGRVKLLRHEVNKNGSAARNTGIRASKGEYIAFLDDDDVWFPTKISKQLEYLHSKDGGEWKGVVSSFCIEKKGKRKDIILKKEGDLTKEVLLMEVSMSVGSNLLIHRDVIEKIGYFDEKYLRHQDLEFLLRYLREFKLAVCSDVHVKRFGHSGTPSGEKLLSIKKIFLKDFEKDIEKFDTQTTKKIYARQWLQVSKHFALDGNVKETIKYYLKSLSFAFLSSNRCRYLILENYITIPFYLLRRLIFNTREKTR